MASPDGSPGITEFASSNNSPKRDGRPRSEHRRPTEVLEEVEEHRDEAVRAGESIGERSTGYFRVRPKVRP